MLGLWLSLAQIAAPGSAAGEPSNIVITPIFVGKVGERGGSFVSPNFTPPDNSLVVMITFGVEDAYDVSKMQPVHNLAGEFTERLALYMTASSHVAAKVWTIPVTNGVLSAAGFAYPDAQSVKGRILMLFAITGYNTADPIRLSVTAPAIGNTDGAMALPRNPDARSVVIAGRLLDVDANEDAAAVPGAGWTELGDESVFERAGLQVQYRIGGTTPNITWSVVNANNATNQQCGGFAIEIKSSRHDASESGGASRGAQAIMKPTYAARLVAVEHGNNVRLRVRFRAVLHWVSTRKRSANVHST